MTLSDTHRRYLLDAAIRGEVIDASGITTRTEEPTGIVFPWNDGNGETVPQLRPDTPVADEKGKLVKYRFPAGAKMILNRLRDDGTGPALIAEGTKQQYTALSYAPPEFAVYGLSGCWNWTDADLSWALGRAVYVLFDGDLTSNKDVHQAASELAEKLDLSGAESVRFVRTTARGTDGLDDVLAKVAEEQRAGYLKLWIDKALTKLPKAPAKKESPFFDKGGLQVLKATTALLEAQPAALTLERKVALYLGGSYHIDGTAFLAAVTKQLGDQFRPAWRAAMEEMAVGSLFAGGKMLPERNSFRKLNCANGMLDLRTLELTPHDPSYMSTVQIPVDWDPDATAPHYEAWLASVCPLQVEDIEEVAGTMLDPSKTPHKAAFLFGPSRSGKSTFLRLMQAIAGQENRTAVTLHDLSTDRFAAANVYGKILNAAADLSSRHVDDLSVFKMMTGEDLIHGNRKYGAQFTFMNQALFAFSANELPTVSESSRAYAERIKPFNFPYSFAGREDPELEGFLRSELPGILVRWVKAYQRLLSRGGYTPTDETVRREFETRSDRVAQWVNDVCVIIEAAHGQILAEHQCTGRRESARAFNAWAERNGGSKMGERKIFDRLGQIPGVVEVRAGRNRTRAFNIVVKDDPNADQGFSPREPEQRAESVVERADSNHPPHVLSPPSLQSPEAKGIKEGGEKVHGEGAQKLPVVPVTATALGFDLETASADELFTGRHEGPYVRLVGVVGGQVGVRSVGHVPEWLVERLEVADTIYGHNILGFDLLALAHHHEADYDALAAKAVDTLVLARLIDPPLSKGMPNGYYGLDAVAQRLGHEGKTDDLKALAKRYGGYDRIPLDSREYQEYLRGDLTATKAVYEGLAGGELTGYAAREMRVVALQNRMTLNGWAIDTDLLAERVEHENAQRAAAVKVLHEEFGLPLAKPDRFKLRSKAEWPENPRGLTIAEARGSLATDPDRAVRLGLAERIPGETYASPWATDAGREALTAALTAAGAEYLPRTKTGALALSSDALGDEPWYDAAQGKSVPGLLQVYGDKPGVRRIAETLCLATGARSKYAEIAKFVTDRGRVHAGVGEAQGSGRWAMTKPSITNMGKRGAAGEERAVLVADPGHVLIACDLSQVDVRAVAGLSQDPEFMKLLAPGRDYHSDMAEIYFGDRARRNDAKPISHGLNYGQSARAVAERNRLDLGMVERAVAARAEAFPRLIEWTGEVRQLAESGVLLDNGFGRLMRPDPDRAWTQGPALMGQGAARDIMTESILRFVSERPDARPYLRGVVHDELVGSFPEAEAEEWSAALAEAFTWEWRGVPILCEVSKPAFRWSECK